MQRWIISILKCCLPGRPRVCLFLSSPTNFKKPSKMESHKDFMILSTAVFHPLSAVPRPGQGQGPLPLWILNPVSSESEWKRWTFWKGIPVFCRTSFLSSLRPRSEHLEFSSVVYFLPTSRRKGFPPRPPWWQLDLQWIPWSLEPSVFHTHRKGLPAGSRAAQALVCSVIPMPEF